MRFLKLLILFITVFLIIGVLCVNFIQNTNPYTTLGDIYPGDMSRRIIWYKINNVLDIHSYGLSKPSSKNSLIIDYSDNDLKYNDSIIKLFTDTDVYIDDELKEWKKTHLIYNKKRFNIKYRFHGSHNHIYKQGKTSLKIKSKKSIKENRKFSLITCYRESSLVNIFIALQEKKLNLIAPDPGEIVLANVNGTVEDYWLTQDLSDYYLKEKYKLEAYKIFKVSDNWTRNGGLHFSELDDKYYYLDEENTIADTSLFRKYKDFKITSTNAKPGEDLKYIDNKYMGRFLANLYFFHQTHYLLGDNNKLLYTDNKIYPIARNEGTFETINNVLKFDRNLVSGNKSETLNLYKKALCNDSIKYYRDKALYNMVNRKNKMLFQLDSLTNLFYDYHKYYNVSFMNVRYNIKKMKKVINHNSLAIKKYLDNGEVIMAFDTKEQKLHVTSDYRVPLKILNIKTGDTLAFNGVELSLQKNEIETSIKEITYPFNYIVKKDDFKIINVITENEVPFKNIIFNYF